MDWLSQAGTGIAIRVRLTPKAATDRIDGIDRDAGGRCHLRARVRALPQDGAANDALVRLIAKALRIPKSALTLASGATARIKTLHVNGAADLETVRTRLEEAAQ